MRTSERVEEKYRGDSAPHGADERGRRHADRRRAVREFGERVSVEGIHDRAIDAVFTLGAG